MVSQKINGQHTILRNTSAHNHDPLAYEKEVNAANNNVKDMAENTLMAPSQIIRSSTLSIATQCRNYLPTKQALKLKVTRCRAPNIKEPGSLQEIVFPENLTHLEGELFILAEYEYYNEKIVILGTKTSLKLLSETTVWLMDGTFHVAPLIMRQVFSIHGLLENQSVPLAFCLMSKKNKFAYSNFFFMLLKLAADFGINLKPLRIICDFEKAIAYAAKKHFPEAELKGCLFHFGQIIWRQVQKHGLAKKYGLDENLSLQIRSIKSLAFVPEEEVSAYYTELYNCIENAEVQKLCKWFRTNYICGVNGATPKYVSNFWSISDAVSHNLPRTQNSVEAWHRRLKVIVGKKHAGVYEITAHLGKELLMSMNTVQQLKDGRIVKKKKSLVIKNKKIKKIIKMRPNIEKVDFLMRIARNIGLLAK